MRCLPQAPDVACFANLVVNCAPEIELDIGEQPWGQSQMGRAVAAFDWSTTPLGPSDSWPISLRTLVQAALNSAFPQAIVWGPDFTTIHNDAFLPILGKKPSAIGRSFADIWSEAWASIGPIAADAYAGKSTFIENFPLVISRNGYDEQAYFTFCYSPLRDDTGNIAGMVDTVVETTGTIHALQTLEVLRRELVHRVKNSMAVTNAVVSASLRHATSLPEARDTISQRIGALGKVQDLLSLSEQGACTRGRRRGAGAAPRPQRTRRRDRAGYDALVPAGCGPVASRLRARDQRPEVWLTLQGDGKHSRRMVARARGLVRVHVAGERWAGGSRASAFRLRITPHQPHCRRILQRQGRN
jgi:two-component sensor histidine kinase